MQLLSRNSINSRWTSLLIAWFLIVVFGLCKSAPVNKDDSDKKATTLDYFVENNLGQGYRYRYRTSNHISHSQNGKFIDKDGVSTLEVHGRYMYVVNGTRVQVEYHPYWSRFSISNQEIPIDVRISADLMGSLVGHGVG